MEYGKEQKTGGNMKETRDSYSGQLILEERRLDRKDKFAA